MNERTTDRKREDGRRRLPLFAWIFFGFSALAGILYVLFLCSTRFSDWFNRTVAAALRAFLAYLTSWIPFSFAEYLILLLPILLFLLALLGIRKYSDSWRDVGIFCLCLLSVGALIFSLFTVGFAPAYRGTKLEQKLGIDAVEIDAEALYDTAQILVARLEEEADAIRYGEDGFSVMPYDCNGMNERLIEAYGSVCDRYSFVQRLSSRVKPVMMSQAMSYTHITGVYTFFTGEANINVAFPDYTLPYTAAHELSHQRGIAREDEANFMAFLVCASSSDAYIRYSGYLNLTEYVLVALRQASPTLYAKVYRTLPSLVRGELAAYSDFFEEYRDSVAGEISGAVNDTVLTIHGTEGTKSYGLVVDLAVAYFADAEYN